MMERQNIARIVNSAYAARSRNDHTAIMDYFAEDCRFQIMGGPQLGAMTMPVIGREQLLPVISRLTSVWDMTNVSTTNLWIDGNTAIARRAGAIRHLPSDQSFETVYIDVILIHNGKIARFEEFIDTHLVAAARTPDQK